MRAMMLALVLALLARAVALPAPVPAVADLPSRAELRTSQNNLKGIVSGMSGFFDANRERLPNDIRDDDGKPLLSWRVAILPYIGEEKLYKQFKVDESWDNEANKKLVEKMPEVYAPVRVKAKAGETFYQRFVGKGAVFGKRGVSAYSLENIPDGAANTALVVEAATPVVSSGPSLSI